MWHYFRKLVYNYYENITKLAACKNNIITQKAQEVLRTVGYENVLKRLGKSFPYRRKRSCLADVCREHPFYLSLLSLHHQEEYP
jgi:hypothetical protein